MIIDGKAISDEVILDLKEKIIQGEDNISLVMILVGNNPASLVYVRNKEKACKKANIKSITYHLDENTTQKEVIDLINKCNEDCNINGIMVQMPLPKHINDSVVLNSISPLKDVDGLSIYSQASLYIGEECIIPATPKGIMTLLKKYNVTITGKNAVVIGRSRLVGKPMAMLLLQNNATVTIAHSKTENLKDVTKKADILIVAVGIPGFITGDMIKKDAVVIDVGINRVNGFLKGDVDFDSSQNVASLITPVPKGVGPMTIASLLENVYICYNKQKELKI